MPNGESWDAHREKVADLMVATVENYAPGFAASVIGRQILSPLDLERQFGLLGGDIFHGALTLNQLFSARPMLGHADYRGPIKGLYHCGSGAHPGGGVTGAPGHNAARVILGITAGCLDDIDELVMAGLRPGQPRLACPLQDVDARHRRQVYAVCARQTAMPGHDENLRSGRLAARGPCRSVHR